MIKINANKIKAHNSTLFNISSMPAIVPDMIKFLLIEKAIARSGVDITPCKGDCFDDRNYSFGSVGQVYYWYNDQDGSTHVVHN